MLAVHRNPPTMREVRTTPITTNHDGANGVTQFYSFLTCFYLFHISIDQSTQTGIAFLDFSKVFDSVSLSHLIRRLDQSGIKGPLLQWLTSYLTDRLQRVVIDDIHAGWLSVTSGVLQGSLLGPALFSLFINGMPRALSHSSTLALFADDAKCFHTIRSVSDCEWSDEGKLVFNSDKCSLCSVTRKRKPITYDYTILN